jgi:hypothetical protein
MNKLFFAPILVVLLTLFANSGYSLSNTFYISTSGYDYCYIWGAGPTYSSARGTADYSICNYNDEYRIGQNVTGGTENVFRGYVRFNSSSLPDNAIVSGFKVANYINTNDFYLDTDTNISIRAYDWNTAYPLNESGNMEIAYDSCLASTGEQVLYFNSSKIPPDYYTDYGVIYTPPMNITSVINVTGYSYFCMLSNWDISNTAPTNNEFIDVYNFYANNMLIVYYTLPAPIPDYINVTLLSPVNDSKLGYNDINFSYQPFANYPFANCSLYINGLWNKSNSSAIVNNTITWINQTGFLNQTLNWTIGCWANNTFNTSFVNYTLNVSKAYPVAAPIPDYINVTLLSPVNDSKLGYNDINFSYQPFANYPFANCSLYINGLWNKSNSSAIVNNTITWINQTGFLNQTLNWTIGCWANNTFNTSFVNYTLNVSKAYPVASPIVPLDISDLPIFEFPSNQFCINDSVLYLEYLYNISDNYSSNFVNRSYLTECAYGCSINRCNASPLDTYLYLAGGILVLLVMLILFKMLL